MPELNALTEKVIGLAINVHRSLGPGLLESAYRKCLCYELKNNGIEAVQEVQIPLKYKELTIDCSYRADIIIPNKLIVEVKSVDSLLPIHEAQLLTYLRLTKIKLGLLMNFNVELLKDGIVRKII
ncbi:GxxExxY protein [candidate division KSB1 bacterium]|nr:GxxExxY protein [candidate division KSB1 bacterium]NIR71978.1 GxxExxY protein [candidate division KSB1 bacterium]NIS23504.1 GxxExxY protein [candidate division KSB1 bacterium]NIT70435.1 GxxExxY protein [candidate division KSB1 bacterium]NIU24133.1 GxxExxY protein [candidate division KSB1 bacterium]